MDPRKTLQKFPSRNPKDPYSQYPNRDFSHISQNQSLLIHDENYELHSEEASSDEEFFDVDIPLEKRDLINNANYFKQLSLSFYGENEPLQPQRLQLNDDNRQHLYTDISRYDARSQSPRSGIEQIHSWRKSPVLPSEKESFQSSYNNLFQTLSKPNPLYTVSPKAQIVHYKSKGSDKQLTKNATGISLKDMNAMNSSPTGMNMSFNRTAASGMYPALNTNVSVFGYASSLTPKNGNIQYRETPGNAVPNKKIIVRPPLKKLGSASGKSKILKEYISATEPSTSYLKNSTSVQTIPKRLQMYAGQDSMMTNLNLKVIDGKLHNAKLKMYERAIPVRPSLLMNTTRSSTNTTKRTIGVAAGRYTKRNYD